MTPPREYTVPVRLTLLENAVMVEIAPDSPHGRTEIIPLPVPIEQVQSADAAWWWLHG